MAIQDVFCAGIGFNPQTTALIVTKGYGSGIAVAPPITQPPAAGKAGILALRAGTARGNNGYPRAGVGHDFRLPPGRARR